MKMSFGSRRGVSCLIGLIFIALAGALVFVIARLNAVERERAAERRAAEAKPVEKTPEQLKRERINEILSAKAPDIGTDASKMLVDGSIASMKRTREACVRQLQMIAMRLSTAEDEVDRLSSELKALRRRQKELEEELRQNPNDARVEDALADCLDQIGEDAETSDEIQRGKKYELAKAKADAKSLREYEECVKREKEALSKAIRRCESDGRVVATAVEFKDLKKSLADAEGQKHAIIGLRSNLDAEVMGVGAENAGVRKRKRERLEKYRRKQSQEQVK